MLLFRWIEKQNLADTRFRKGNLTVPYRPVPSGSDRYRKKKRNRNRKRIEKEKKNKRIETERNRKT